MGMQTKISWRGYVGRTPKDGLKVINALNRNIELFRKEGIPKLTARIAYQIAENLRILIVNNILTQEFANNFEKLADKTIWQKIRLAEVGIIPQNWVEYTWLATGQIADSIKVSVDNTLYQDIHDFLSKNIGKKSIKINVGIPKGTQHKSYYVKKTGEVEEYTADTLEIATALEYGGEHNPPRPVMTLTQKSDEYKMSILSIKAGQNKMLKRIWLLSENPLRQEEILEDYYKKVGLKVKENPFGEKNV